MTSSNSYDLSRFADLDREMERLRDQALQTWPKEARLLAQYGLRDGMSVLELGSGPGFITEQLLKLLPTGAVTTVERSPEMLGRAARYLEGKSGGRLRALDGDIMATGLPADSFDFAIARFLYQHLPDPVDAAKESLRVLKPGGKLVLVDVDDGIWGVVNPPRPSEEDVTAAYIRAQAARGGNRHVGRLFPRILRDAGFARIELDAVIWHSDFLGDRAREVLEKQWTSDDLDPLVREGYLSAERAEESRKADQAWLASPDLLALYPLLVGCGTKP